MKKEKESRKAAEQVAQKFSSWNSGLKKARSKEFNNREQAVLVAANLRHGFPRSEGSWEVWYEYLPKKDPKAIRKKATAMKAERQLDSDAILAHLDPETRAKILPNYGDL